MKLLPVCGKQPENRTEGISLPLPYVFEFTSEPFPQISFLRGKVRVRVKGFCSSFLLFLSQCIEPNLNLPGARCEWWEKGIFLRPPPSRHH